MYLHTTAASTYQQVLCHTHSGTWCSTFCECNKGMYLSFSTTSCCFCHVTQNHRTGDTNTTGLSFILHDYIITDDPLSIRLSQWIIHDHTIVRSNHPIRLFNLRWIYFIPIPRRLISEPSNQKLICMHILMLESRYKSVVPFLGLVQDLHFGQLAHGCVTNNSSACGITNWYTHCHHRLFLTFLDSRIHEYIHTTVIVTDHALPILYWQFLTNCAQLTNFSWIYALSSLSDSLNVPWYIQTRMIYPFKLSS